MEKTFIFDMQSNTSQLKDLSDFVQDRVSPYVLNKSMMDDIIISIDEVATNIILHAYEKTAGNPMKLVIKLTDEKAEFTFHHKGKTFNPERIGKPNLTKEMDAREINGMGLYIIKQFMDEVEYKFKDSTKDENTIRLVKKLKK